MNTFGRAPGGPLSPRAPWTWYLLRGHVAILEKVAFISFWQAMSLAGGGCWSSGPGAMAVIWWFHLVSGDQWEEKAKT